MKTHDEIKLGNVCDLTASFQPKQFDACITLDVIEHLTKEGGYKLIAEMESIARKKVIFFTPSGFKPQATPSRVTCRRTCPAGCSKTAV